jgi:hypothetical protein
LASYEELREKHLTELKALLPAYTERLSWSADRLNQEREEKLRTLVRLAKERSPWHCKRLVDIDPETLTEADLDRIPPMTKSDLMDHWDDIVTDRRLNLDLVNSHLESLTTDQYLLDEYHAVASGGSTGRRGVFVYDWTAWTLLYVMMIRRAIQVVANDPQFSETPPTRAVIAAEKATHLSSSLSQTFDSSLASTHYFPITLPIKQIVAGLNELQPRSVWLSVCALPALT